MYCKACGKALEENCTICMGCGVPVGKGGGYCPVCGQPVAKEAVLCVHCGVALSEPKQEIPKEARSRVVAGILGIFLGVFGVHNFYLKRKGRAIAQLLMGLGLVIGYIGMITGLILDSVFYDSFFSMLILMSLVTTVGLLTCMASAIWAFVESILLLCGAVKEDGRGIPLRD